MAKLKSTGGVLWNAVKPLFGGLLYPSRKTVDFTKSHTGSPKRTTLVIVVGIFVSVWLTYLVWTLNIPYPLAAVPVILVFYAYANAVNFVSEWHATLRNGFYGYAIPSRFEFIKIEKVGPKVLAGVLLINLVLGVVEVYDAATYPKLLLGVPYALYIGCRLVLRLKIPREKELRTIKECVIDVRLLPKTQQATAMILLRDEISNRLHSLAPLMTLNINPILNAVYYIGFHGTPKQVSDTRHFLDTIEDDLLKSKDPKTMFGHILSCSLASNALPSGVTVSFDWERRTDWRRRFETIAQVVIALASVVSTLAALRLLPTI